LPVFDVDARRIDPHTGELLADADRATPGEIVVHAPQVMQGYWQQPEATAEAFISLGGRRYLRTGDLAVVDDDGYFFMVDRLKRMINAAGYKVWPAEVEALLHAHPAILEACVIGTQDPRRGETVKALVVLKPGHTATEQQVIEWAQGQMAAYKCPRVVKFVPALPKSGAGKVAWRALQDAENKETS
jgi:fatty-acyl-CoA synthase